MEIGKQYTGKAGVKRTPLQLSECGRFVKTETIFNNDIKVIRDYWVCIFKERIKTGLWNQ